MFFLAVTQDEDMSEDSGETSQERAPIIVSPRRTGSSLGGGISDHSSGSSASYVPESTPARSSVKSVIVRVGSSTVANAFKSEVSPWAWIFAESCNVCCSFFSFSFSLFCVSFPLCELRCGKLMDPFIGQEKCWL